MSYSVTIRPLEHFLYDTQAALVENAQQLKEGSSVPIDGGGQVVTE